MILVTGGAGIMGSRFVKELVKKGNKVRVLALPNDPGVSNLKGIDCEIVYGDISKPESLVGIFDNIETVYHLAAIIIAYDKDIIWKINVEGTRNVVKGSIDAKINHFIYISSVSAAWPEGSDYAQSKVAAEKIVKSQDLIKYTIVRPTLIYSCNGGQEFMMFLESLKKYPFVFFVGNGKARKNPVLVDDIVKGLVAIAGNKKSFGKTYDFSGGEEISMRDLAKLLLEYEGLSKLFIYIPIPICRIIAFFMEKTMKKPLLTNYAISRMLQEAAPDNDSARKDLGYSPVGIRKGLMTCYGEQQRKK